MPYSQGGYIVAFVPFADGAPSGPWEVFADNFAGVDPIPNTSDAAARPMGLAQGPDGSLYVSDSVKGKIWRIQYKGDRGTFGAAQLARMEARKTAQAHIRNPHEQNDVIGREVLDAGAKLYETYCSACHQRDGKGDGSRFPPVASTRWVSGDPNRLIGIVLNGLQGEIQVEGQTFNGVMPAQRVPDRRAGGADPDLRAPELRQLRRWRQAGRRGGGPGEAPAVHATDAAGPAARQARRPRRRRPVP